MNWEAIGAVSEVVGAIGVIATLAYLAVQVRQNSAHLAESAKLAEASLIEANANAAAEVRKMLLLNPDLMDLQIRGSQSFERLDHAERARFDLLMRITFLQAQTMYLRHIMFRHDPENYAGAVPFIEQSLRKPGIREWLDQVQTDWRPEFREMIQATIERIDRGKGQ
ncbi:MAG: hypothetical protein KDI55_23270 [Anaerolineae bacterium]|nr:hypothetical protein [Anaerolineae bacterium]MCB1703205.1 hypothetical protein [Halioglobus sp.]